MASPSRTEGRRAGSSGRRFAIYGGLLLVAAVTLLVRWAASREAGVTWREAPHETRGVWTTSDARYDGRAIEVGATTVTLRLGEAGANAGRLQIARELQDDGDRVLRLEYVTLDGPDALEMVVGADGATMALRNQPGIVWHRTGDVAPAPPAAVVPAVGTLPTRRLDPVLVGGLLVLALGGALLLFLLRRSSAPAAGGNDDRGGGAPGWLVGVWTTADPREGGRTIRIASHFGYEQFGPGDVRVGGEIVDVHQRRDDGARVATLRYQTPEGAKDLELMVDRDGLLRVGDGTRSVWVRR